MTKTQMINRIARNCKISKTQATKAVNTMFEGIQSSLKRGRNCQFSGFGSFSMKKQAAFTARNPRTGTSRKVAATKYVNFTPTSNWNPAKPRRRKSSSQKRSRRN